MKSTLFFCIILSMLCPRFAADDNPYLRMAGKPYAAYSEELEKTVYMDIDERDSLWMAHTAAQMREAARVSGNRKWMLEALLLEAVHSYFRSLRLLKPDRQNIESQAGEMIESLLPVVEKAKKLNAEDVQLRALYKIMQRYMDPIKNHEMGFRYCLELDKALSTVSAGAFPLKPVYYVHIASHYYSFREYETAKLFLEKVLEDPEIAYRQRVLESAWNDLGLIYRDLYDDLVASDSCFNRVLELKPTEPELISPTAGTGVRLSLQEEYELWTAIAKGNLGHNAYLRDEYEKAIPLLKYGIEKSVENNPYNYPYAAGKALTLAVIYLKKSDLTQGKHYIDKTYELLDMSGKKDKVEGSIRNTDLWVKYYRLQSRYWRIRGDYTQALLYADSTRAARMILENEFNLRKLYSAGQQVKQEELEAEKLRSTIYRRSFLMITALMSIILLLLCMLYYYYRKNKTAYQELVQKNRQWAGDDRLEKITAFSQAGLIQYEDTEQENNVTNNGNGIRQATEKEIKLTGCIHEVMVSKQVYRDSDITLDSLAHMLGVNRETVSHSINRTTGKNFSRFLNEYRIKEAVRVLLMARNRAVNFDELSEQIGFNNRETFQRVFKQVTGLPPNEFKNNG